jgi:acyl-coenzyme A thioesterase PaaI-like protein
MDHELPNPFPDSACFFCGKESPGGLRLRFSRDDATGEVFSDYVPDMRFAGQGTILHGGIQAGILDEIMGWTGHAATGSLAVTVKLEAEYLAPVYIDGTPIRISCALSADEGKTMTLEARITDSRDTLCTRATGRFHKVSPEKYDALVRRSPSR